jgi:hypothetical protein
MAKEISYADRIRKWARGLFNIVQWEKDGSTSYYFGSNSYINARTLSGTGAQYRRPRPAPPMVQEVNVAVTVTVDATAAMATIEKLRQQTACFNSELLHAKNKAKAKKN